jgi:hypothetical protein
MPEEGPSPQLAFDMATAQLAEQLSGADSDDVKALGYLAVDIGGAAVIFAGHSGLNFLWPLCLSVFGVAALLLVLALRSSIYPTGPNPLEIYYDASETPVLDAILALETARAGVQRIREGSRRRLYRLSVAATVVAIVVSALALWR